MFAFLYGFFSSKKEIHESFQMDSLLADQANGHPSDILPMFANIHQDLDSVSIKMERSTANISPIDGPSHTNHAIDDGFRGFSESDLVHCVHPKLTFSTLAPVIPIDNLLAVFPAIYVITPVITRCI